VIFFKNKILYLISVEFRSYLNLVTLLLQIAHAKNLSHHTRYSRSFGASRILSLIPSTSQKFWYIEYIGTVSEVDMIVLGAVLGTD